MKLKTGLLSSLMLTACATSPPVPPRTSALCDGLKPIEFHAPIDVVKGQRGDWWGDTAQNVFDTPETVRRILVHNERVKALCQAE